MVRRFYLWVGSHSQRPPFSVSCYTHPVTPELLPFCCLNAAFESLRQRVVEAGKEFPVAEVVPEPAEGPSKPRKISTDPFALSHSTNPQPTN